MGRLLKLMDEMCVYVAYMCQKPPEEDFYAIFYLVTVLVDRITVFDQNINLTRDVRAVGYVTRVGKSSMELTVKLQVSSLNRTMDNVRK
jgi:acyl-CoA hydrolase